MIKEDPIREYVISEIILRLKSAFRMEKKIRREWLKILPRTNPPSAIGLIGDEDKGFECYRSAWWANLGCEKLASGYSYQDITHEVEKAKIPGLSFGS